MAAMWTKGMIIPIEVAIAPVVFQFNPYEVHIDKSANWAQIPAAGREQPFLQYGCGGVKKVSFSVEVSKYDMGDAWVKTFCDSLIALMKPSVQGAGLNRPPRVQVILGAHLNFTAIVEGAKVRHGAHRGMTSHLTYLAAPGTLLPRNATVVIQLWEWQ